MKNPKTAIHFVIGLEVGILAAVLIFAVLNPIKDAVTGEDVYKNNHQNTVSVSTESEIETETESEEEIVVPVMEYTEAVKEKVLAMSLEERVAQMFATTPEQLTGMRRVTVTGNTTKNAISSIPVGGMIYSSLNFEGPSQTAAMTRNLQNYYMEKFGMPLFVMVAETGGEDGSPLAKANGFTVEKAPAEIGMENDAAIASSSAANIAEYMKNQEFNTNVGIDGSYSEDTAVASAMLDAAIAAYKEAGIYTASSVYHSASDIVMLGETTSVSDAVYDLRYTKQYQGIVFANVVTDEQSVIDAINAGADMVYCQNDLKTIYAAVVDAATNGTINEELINEAVMRILTYKGYE